jgi:hypothetical protein
MSSHCFTRQCKMFDIYTLFANTLHRKKHRIYFGMQKQKQNLLCVCSPTNAKMKLITKFQQLCIILRISYFTVYRHCLMAYNGIFDHKKQVFSKMKISEVLR